MTYGNEQAEAARLNRFIQGEAAMTVAPDRLVDLRAAAHAARPQDDVRVRAQYLLSLLDERDKWHSLWREGVQLFTDAAQRVAALEEGLRAMVAACEQDNLWQLEEALDKARSLLQSSAASQGGEE